MARSCSTVAAVGSRPSGLASPVSRQGPGQNVWPRHCAIDGSGRLGTIDGHAPKPAGNVTPQGLRQSGTEPAQRRVFLWRDRFGMLESACYAPTFLQTTKSPAL